MAGGYKIATGETAQRDEMFSRLTGLDLVPAATRERIVTAWVSAWSSSSFAQIDDMPYSPHAPDYRLIDHVNDVTRAGIELGRRADSDWALNLDWERYLSILILHDVDKPLMFVRENGVVKLSPLSFELPHGIVGAMLLKDLDFDQIVVSTVALHSEKAPYHGRNVEAYLLYYADMFSTDHAYMLSGAKPYYQRKHV